MSERNNDKEENYIPLLDGTNYSEWYLRMRFLLRSRELLDVCENPLGQDATPASRNRWNKLSFEAINLITSRINQRVFLEVVRPETSDKADLLWTCINEHYASKRNMNKGRVWMNWQKLNYTGNLQVYIDNTRKFLLDLQSVVEMLTLNDNLLEKPDQVLLGLQEYANLRTAKVVAKDPSPVSALISSSDHQFKITHFCSNGLHNPKCTTHRKDQCYVEYPHLRPPQRNNKRKAQGTPASAHLATAHALVTSTISSQGHPNQVVIDCGATHHMFHSKEVFTSLFDTPNLFISTGDSMSQLRAEGMGTVSIIIDKRPLNLVDCLYVPKLNCNLISLLQLFHEQVTITKNLDTFDLKTNENILFHGKIINNLMKADFIQPTSLSTTIVDDLWHKRLGHPGRGPVRAMGLPSFNGPCHTCDLNKIHQLPFKDQFEHLTRMLKHKSEAFDCFIEAKNLMETQHDRRIKRLISDRGGEFLNDRFKQLASSCGFIHTFSPPYTPQHNGFAERANRTLLDKAKCLLNGSGLPKRFWAEAVNTATLLCNLIPTPSRHNNSPYALWTGKSPRIKKLRIFGCQAIVLIQRNLREWKLGESGCRGIFLGYENDMSSYRVMRLSDGKIVISKHVLFDESVFPNSPTHLSSTSPLVIPLVGSEEGSDNNESCSEEPCDHLGSQESVDEARRPENDPSSFNQEEEGSDEITACPPTDASTEPQPVVQSKLRVIGPRHPTLISSDIDRSNILPYSRRAAALLSSAEVVPRTFKMAVNSTSKDIWLAAISKELKSMDDLKVWDVIELSSTFKLVGTTWVFKVKKDHLGNVVEHKARLCAQGFTQTAGIDFEKTYSLTGRLNSLRTLIAFAASNRLRFHQINIKSAFLNAPLTECVYLSIPQGLSHDRRKYCLRLNKAIYGLKQAPLAWYERLRGWLVKVNFLPCVLDPCVFFWSGESPVWLYVHVDDIAIFGKDVDTFKIEISKEFEIKDIGEADLMLGVKVTQTKDFIALDQQHFSESLLELYGMSDCRPVATPLVPNHHLSLASEEELSLFNSLGISYRSAIGSINYLSTATRPDLSYAVSSLSQFLERPGINHWKAFLHVLRYLKGTQDLSLTYRRNDSSGIVAYSDADWGNCPDTRRKQPTVSLSTSEAEYKSLCDDNQGCIDAASGNSGINGKRMKHVDIQLHFVREAIAGAKTRLVYTPTGEMLADFLTNVLADHSVC
ncbi:hypothetical protein O181_042084 [Austropuccinia psidii MF-1]|uniref:Integrase catalytic domain-containing protein n=1 Tax=Austropuccinia psidii MF-1 TaxID=1389203 RepID=A0A9Q3DFE1_9BASI|nr:hypothetical protein [Austropuccinia psidii MF-1]